MKSIFITLAWLTVVFCSSGCKDDHTEENKFDRKLILEAATNQLILPAFTDFSAQADSLLLLTNQFISQPSESTLENLRGSWQKTKLSWSAAEIFSFGPVDELVAKTAINLWPTDTSGIELAINAYNGSDSYLLSVARNRRGLPAIEYLLFHGSEAMMVEEFNTQANRKDYLRLIAQELKTHASAILDSWNGAYKTTFVNNTGNDANASITLLVNEMIGLLETVKNFKVATPAGIRTQGSALPRQVESYDAHLSLPCIQKNLDAIQEVFTGGTGNGFDDYLDAFNIDIGEKKLSQVIIEQIQKCKASSDAITLPLEQAVIEQPLQVRQLFTDLQQLTVYMKTDMMSRLGLLVTYSDSDGD